MLSPGDPRPLRTSLTLPRTTTLFFPDNGHTAATKDLAGSKPGGAAKEQRGDGAALDGGPADGVLVGVEAAVDGKWSRVLRQK